MTAIRTLVVSFVFASLTGAQDLGGGAPASHGRVPRFALESWIPGTGTAARFDDAPPSVSALAGILAFAPTAATVPGFAGTLLADPALAIVFAMPGGRVSLGTLPLVASGARVWLQGVWLDPLAGAGFTDAHIADLFNPIVMVGNQRQTANSISVVDLVSRTVTGRLGNSENGSVAFSPDRTRAYVCEPGLRRNVVTVYDLLQVPIAQVAQLPTTGGIRYRGEFDPLGSRLYVPVHDGVDVFDTDPASPSYHQHLAKIPASIAGSSTSIFTGPIDLAVTPDGTRLLIAYGAYVNYPATTPMDIVDLVAPGYATRTIQLTTGGTAIGLATKNAVRVSPDGRYAYVLEFGFPATFPLVMGFANGALVNVVDLVTETEVATIDTFGVAQHEMVISRTGRDLWIAQVTAAGLAQLVRIDVDRRSATRNTLRSTITLDPVVYSSSTGARGVGVTPDGGTVCVSLVEGPNHPTPELVTLDAWTEALVGAPIGVESLPATVAVQTR